MKIHVTDIVYLGKKNMPAPCDCHMAKNKWHVHRDPDTVDVVPEGEELPVRHAIFQEITEADLK